MPQYTLDYETKTKNGEVIEERFWLRRNDKGSCYVLFTKEQAIALKKLLNERSDV